MATEKIIKIRVDKKGADNSVKDLDKNIKKTDKSTSGLSGSLDKASGGAVSAFKAMKVGLLSAASGFKSLRFAIIATGIGALIIAILAVKQAFTASEEGQNKFAKILGVIGAITGNLVDLLSDFGEKVISVFENPKKAIKDFANLIKDNILNRFNGLLELIPSISKAINQLFKGDFSGAAETATNAVAKVVLGTENLTESIKGAGNALKEFGKQNIAEGKAAAQVADDRARADKIERDLIVDKAKAEKEIANLRLIAKQQNKFSAKERQDALIKAGEIQDELIGRESEVLKLRADAISLENTFARSNKENLNAEARAIAAVIQAETSRINFKRQLARELTAAENEQESERNAKIKEQELIDSGENKKIQEKIKAESKLEEDRLKNISKINEDFKKKNEDLEDEDNISKLERQFERDESELLRLDATEQQKYELKKYYSGLISNEQDKIIKDLDNKRLKQADNEVKLDQAVADAKNNAANRTANLLIELGGKAAKVGKAIAIAQTIRSGIEGVQNAYSTAQKSPITALFPAYPIVQAGLAGAFSALQVKRILATPETGGGANNSQRGGETNAPSFNLVEGTQQNQLAQSINASNQRPMQAIVVASSVTNAQQANRNKYEESSI